MHVSVLSGQLGSYSGGAAGVGDPYRREFAHSHLLAPTLRPWLGLRCPRGRYSLEWAEQDCSVQQRRAHPLSRNQGEGQGELLPIPPGLEQTSSVFASE